MPISSKGKKNVFFWLSKDFEGRIFDLGSGFGTMVFPLSNHCKQAQIYGYETAILPYFVSRAAQMVFRKRNIRIYRKNLYAAEFAQADIIFCYLYPRAMIRLTPIIKEKAKPGTRVISYAFALPGMQADKVEEIGKLYPTKLYYYQVG